MLVAEKKPVNLSLPLPLLEQFEGITDKLGGKEKWVAMSAAMLALLDLSEEVRRELLARVAGAPMRGFNDLVEQARAGELLEGIRRSLDPSAVAFVKGGKGSIRRDRDDRDRGR